MSVTNEHPDSNEKNRPVRIPILKLNMNPRVPHPSRVLCGRVRVLTLSLVFGDAEEIKVPALSRTNRETRTGHPQVSAVTNTAQSRERQGRLLGRSSSLGGISSEWLQRHVGALQFLFLVDERR